MTTMAETTTLKDAALRLMQDVLRGGRPLAAEYPLVFRDDSDGCIEVTEADGEVASTCAWLTRTLIFDDVAIPAAVVGSVATEEKFRGRGLATQTVQRAVDGAAEEGAALALLWADDSTWYQERGWVPFGTENVYVVEESNAFLLPDPVGVRPMEARDMVAVHDLYRQHRSHVDRTLEETRVAFTVPGMDALVTERDGQVVGYVCMGRGEDLQFVIHEWGGAPDAVLPCVTELWERAQAVTNRIFMMVPETEADFLAYFRFVKAHGADGILALARVASTKAMADVFNQATPGEVNAVATSDNTIDLTGPAGTIRLTDHEILLALCPPRGDRRVTDVVETQTGVAMPNLPVQPFVWGLDSI